ncbi:MAG: hypothetical protein IPN45_08925 [Actinomycetales bacterium]|jgi:hypothetical protein|nr:hypothetical protein [Actinomycetales bacterium]
MGVINEIVVVFHLLSMAAIVGGWLAAGRQGRIVPSMVWGGRLTVVTGLILVAIAEMIKTPNHMKIGVKFGIALAVLGLGEIANSRQRKLAIEQPALVGGGAPAAAARAASPAAAGVGSLVDAMFWLTVLNVAIAALWRSYS